MRELWRDVMACRELAWSLTVRDFSAMYRQSYAGYLWAFLPPLFASLTFILLQSGNVLSLDGVSIPYPAFVMIGTILWQVFVDALNNPTKAMQNSLQMLIKVNFPREALILSSIQMTLIGLAIRLVILVPILLWYRLSVDPAILLFPVGVVSLVLLGTMFGVFLGTLGLLYQDVQRGLALVTTFWMFLTPVVFPGVREGALGLVMKLNPVTHVLATTRDWLTGQPAEYLAGFYWVMALCLIGLMCAALVYRVFLPRIIERLGM